MIRREACTGSFRWRTRRYEKIFFDQFKFYWKKTILVDKARSNAFVHPTVLLCILSLTFDLFLAAQPIINSTITPNMTITKTSQKFVQINDVMIYGLGFNSEPELNKVKLIQLNQSKDSQLIRKSLCYYPNPPNLVCGKVSSFWIQRIVVPETDKALSTNRLSLLPLKVSGT